MLHSKNLISKAGQESYNTQVRQINVMQKEEAAELKHLYEDQKVLYDALDEQKATKNMLIADLENRINCVEAMIAYFKNLAGV